MSTTNGGRINSQDKAVILKECANVAKGRGHNIVAIQANDYCFTGTEASKSYARDGGYPQRESNNARSRMVSFQPSSVANVFFSDANLGPLHQAIRYRVWVDSDRKLVIGRQSEDQLVFVMRSVFLTDSYNR
eukprot:gene696-2127_t